MDNSNTNFRFSFLSSKAEPDDLRDFISKAKADQVDYVVVSSFYLPAIRALLNGSKIKIAAVIDYPLGGCLARAKAAEAAEDGEGGADAILMVPNLAMIKAKDYEFYKSEIALVKDASPKNLPFYVYYPEDVSSGDKAPLQEATRQVVGVHLFFFSPDNIMPAHSSSADQPAPVQLPATKSGVPAPVETTSVEVGEKKKHHVFTKIGGVLWLIFIGWWMAALYAIRGVLCCISLIFIPVGVQCFKLTKLAFNPFGKQVSYAAIGGKMFFNVLWAIFVGWELALINYIFGALLCVTILFIPCGKQYFKFAKILFLPLGATIEKVA